MRNKILAFILVLVLALSLTACNKGGETPNGDNSTSGTVANNTIEQMKQQLNALESAFATAKKATTNPIWSDPSKYDAEKKADIDDRIAYQFGSEVDVDKLISEVIQEYGEFINIHITPEAIRTATLMGRGQAVQNKNYKSITGLPESSYNKANDYLKSKGKEPLGDFETLDMSKIEQVAKNSIAALAIAASLFYEPNWEGLHNNLYDLVNAFGCAFADTRGFILGLHNNYYVIEDTAIAENELNQKLEILAPTNADISKYYKNTNEFDFAQCAKDLGYEMKESNFPNDFNPQMAAIYSNLILPDGAKVDIQYSRGVGTSGDGTETISHRIEAFGVPKGGDNTKRIYCFEFRLGILQVGSDVKQSGNIGIGFKTAGGNDILLQEKQIQQLIGVLKTVKPFSSFEELMEYGELLSSLYGEYNMIIF